MHWILWGPVAIVLNLLAYYHGKHDLRTLIRPTIQQWPETHQMQVQEPYQPEILSQIVANNTMASTSPSEVLNSTKAMNFTIPIQDQPLVGPHVATDDDPVGPYVATDYDPVGARVATDYDPLANILPPLMLILTFLLLGSLWCCCLSRPVLCRLCKTNRRRHNTAENGRITHIDEGFPSYCQLDLPVGTYLDLIANDDHENGQRARRSHNVTHAESTPLHGSTTSLQVSTFTVAMSWNIVLQVLVKYLAQRNNQLARTRWTHFQTARQLRRQVSQKDRQNQMLRDEQAETPEERYEEDNLARLELQLINENSRAKIAQLNTENGSLITENGSLTTENGSLTTEKANLTTKNGKLARSREKQSKARRDLLKSNSKLVDDNRQLSDTNGQLSDTNGQLSETNGELSRTKEKFAEENRQLVRNNDQLVQNNDELLKLNQALSHDKSQLGKANEALSESRQRLTDKTGQMSQINRGLYAQYRGLHDYVRGEVQAKNEWAESYQNVFNYTRGVVEAHTELLNSHQSLVSSIKATEELLASGLTALAPDSQLHTPPDSVDERMRYIFSGIFALGTAFQNARETFLSTPIATETPGASLDAPIVTATPSTPLDAPATTETPSSSSETTRVSNPNARVSRAGCPQISSIALPGPSQQLVCIFDLYKSVIVWAVCQNFGRSSRFMFRLNALVLFLVLENQNIRSMVKNMHAVPLIGRVIIHIGSASSKQPSQAPEPAQPIQACAEDEMEIDSASESKQPNQASGSEQPEAQTGHADNGGAEKEGPKFGTGSVPELSNFGRAVRKAKAPSKRSSKPFRTPPAFLSNFGGPDFSPGNGNVPTAAVSNSFGSAVPVQSSPAVNLSSFGGHNVPDFFSGNDHVAAAAAANSFGFGAPAQSSPAVNLSTFGGHFFPGNAQAPAAATSNSLGFGASAQSSSAVNLSTIGGHFFPGNAQAPAASAFNSFGSEAPAQPAPAVNHSKGKQKLPEFSFGTVHIPTAAPSSSFGDTVPMDLDFAKTATAVGGFQFGSASTAEKPVEQPVAARAPVEQPVVARAQRAAVHQTRAEFIQGLCENHEEIKAGQIAIDEEVSFKQLGIDMNSLKRHQIKLVVTKAFNYALRMSYPTVMKDDFADAIDVVTNGF